LEGEQRCATGDDADPTTRDVKICSNTKNDTEVTIVDTPGLGGLEKREVKRILKNISQSMDETADILL
jgi:predicted GTPase